MIVIRLNPDKYTNNLSIENNISQIKRFNLHVRLKLYLRENISTNFIHIFYLFYDKTNPQISKNIAHTCISSEDDFIKFKYINNFKINYNFA